MEKWNRNDWQGKRKDQVDYSNKLVVICVGLLVLLLIIFGITNLIQ